MNSHDVRTLQDRRNHRRECSVQSITHWRVFTILSERPPDERFTGWSAQDREPQSMQLVEASQQRIILFEVFSKAESRIEHDLVAIDSRRQRVIRPICKLAFHQKQQF